MGLHDLSLSGTASTQTFSTNTRPNHGHISSTERRLFRSCNTADGWKQAPCHRERRACRFQRSTAEENSVGSYKRRTSGSRNRSRNVQLQVLVHVRRRSKCFARRCADWEGRKVELKKARRDAPDTDDDTGEDSMMITSSSTVLPGGDITQ
jgi:hypothetical protein